MIKNVLEKKLTYISRRMWKLNLLNVKWQDHHPEHIEKYARRKFKT